MWGAVDVAQNPLTSAADYFHRDYKYDSLLRPWSVTTRIPANAAVWNARDFTMEYGYDHNYGRLKAIGFPSPSGSLIGEIASVDYDSRGNVIGETSLDGNGGRGTTYRAVTAMSERGQVKLQSLGNGIGEHSDFDESTGMPFFINAFGLKDPQPPGCNANVLVHQVDYKYDQFLNVASQVKQFVDRDNTPAKALRFSGCTPVGVSASETYQYDDLQRLMGTQRTWSWMVPSSPTTSGDSYNYDDLGNITSKPDYADTYTYGARPHAVVSVSGLHNTTFTYDANGNMISGDGRQQTFDLLDRPVNVVMGSVTTQFLYAPDGSRYLQRTSTPGAQKTVYYVDKAYERIDWSGGPTEEKTYVGPSVAVYHVVGGTRDVRYVHMDRLGSVDAVTNGSGVEFVGDAHGFDAFGKPRARDWTFSGDKLHPDTDYGKTTEHGFTGHEHLDDTYLIHMNGRIYDYRLGRFLSVDPIISNPANSQSINPYSYIGNNPLSGVDPTGYRPSLCLTDRAQVCDTIEVNAPENAPTGKQKPKELNSNGAQPAEKTSIDKTSANAERHGVKELPNAIPLEVVGQREDGTWEVDLRGRYIAARVAWGWVFGLQEFVHGEDAFTGDPLSWGQRALSLLGSVSMFVGAAPGVEGAIAESRLPSVIQAVDRATELKAAIPAAQEGRITMAVGVGENAAGVRQVVIGTSEPAGYLRPGVTLKPGEALAGGTGHAEANVVRHAQENGVKLDAVGATRPICKECAAAIVGAGAQPVTRLRNQAFPLGP